MQLQPVSILITQLSQQAQVVKVAQAQYDQALSNYRSNEQTPHALGAARDKLDAARTELKVANEAWEKLCDELLQLAGQENAQSTNTGNAHIDKMFQHAPTVLATKRLCKEASDEYLTSREQNHPDQGRLIEIRKKLDPAQTEASEAMQRWGELCKELLQLAA